MNAYSTLQVSSLQTWNVPQLNQSDGCGPTTIRYPNPVPSPHSSTAVASVTIPVSDAVPYAISPETSPRDLTLRHNEIPNLDDIPDIAKEALRITKESLGSECQLLHQDPTNTRKLPTIATGSRLNKFVRRLHDMLKQEQASGVVEWRKGLLVLHSTNSFAKQILPQYFNTRNFKTFRRQLNYYGFVHVRSFTTAGSATTALWVNQHLAETGSDDISSVLRLKRVEPCDAAKTAESRRERKELAIHTVEEDLGVSARTLQVEQIRSMALRGSREQVQAEILRGLERTPAIIVNAATTESALKVVKPVRKSVKPPVPREIHCTSMAVGGDLQQSRDSSSNQGSTESISSYGSGVNHDDPTQISLDEDSGAANLLLFLSKSS